METPEERATIQPVDGNSGAETDSENNKAQAKPAATVSKTSAIVLILALGFHAVFEGIAFGLLTEIVNAG